jgi:hypothetical protein
MKVGGFLLGSVIFLANNIDDDDHDNHDDDDDDYQRNNNGDYNDDNDNDRNAVFTLLHKPISTISISISTIIIIIFKYTNLNQSIFWFDVILHRVLINIYIMHHIICHNTH